MASRALIFLAVLTVLALPAAAKPKQVGFGKTYVVKWFTGTDEKTSMDMKVRAIVVNGDPKEFSTGAMHEITDKLFVVRRAVRLNDSLPQDDYRQPKWRWQPAGWLMVDRTTGHITKIALPEFDPYYSQATWYRDFAAYCGIAENGEKLDAVVVQLGSRKPVMKKFIRAAKNADDPDSECAPPTWERDPMRVTFHPTDAEAFTYTVREHAIELEPATPETQPDKQK